MFEEKDDTILARWLANELTPEELDTFEKTEEFQEYQAIANASTQFLKPDYNKDALFDKIVNGRETSKKGNVLKLRPIIFSLSLAASIIILLGIFFSSTTYSTGIGEQLLVELTRWF
jgi:hypothetical protein